MQLKSLGIKGRRAILATTVAFSWLVSNPLLPGLEGVAFAKGNHGGHHAGETGKHGAHHGKTETQHHQRGKNRSTTQTTAGDDDASDDDSSDDDSSDDDSNDDNGGSGDNGSDDDAGGSHG